MFVHKNICILENLVSVVLKKTLFLFKNIGIIIFVSAILKKKKRFLFLFISVVPKFPKDIVPTVLLSVITLISLKLH